MIPSVYSARRNGWLPSLFNDFFDEAWVTPVFKGTAPAINVSEDEQEYKVEVAAPGMTKEDFCISLTSDDDLVIAMEKKCKKECDRKETKKYLRREFSYSKFEQRLTLPDNVEKQRITAAMNDGVLTINIPKKTEEEKAQETLSIEIK